MTQDLVPAKKLSELIGNKANLALPQIVSVFLVRHETALYDRKGELQDKIVALKDEQQIQTETVSKSVSFDAYVGVKVAKLGLISILASEPATQWADEQISCTIGFEHTDMTESNSSRGRDHYSKRTDFHKVFTKKIPPAELKKRTRLAEDLGDASNELQRVVTKLTDMPRTKRRIEGAIAEQSLMEQGLEEFIQGEEMQKLISID